MFCLYTPGGGGYGKVEEANRKPQTKRKRLNETFPERGSVFEYRMAQEGVWQSGNKANISGKVRNDKVRNDKIRCSERDVLSKEAHIATLTKKRRIKGTRFSEKHSSFIQHIL